MRVCFVWGEKDLQIDLGPRVPGARGFLLTCLLCVLMSAVLLSDCSGPSQSLFIVLFPSEPDPGSASARTYRRRYLALSGNVDRMD